jgi:hypothetical protein
MSELGVLDTVFSTSHSSPGTQVPTAIEIHLANTWNPSLEAVMATQATRLLAKLGDEMNAEV